MAAPDPRVTRGIVWIASYPRSGNTWIRVFLYHLVRLVGGDPADAGVRDELNGIACSEAARIDLFARFLGRPVAEASFDEVAAARPKVQAAIAAEADGPVLAKTHGALGLVNGFPTVDFASTAGAIYVVRNPLDIVASLATHFGLSLDQAIDRMCMENCTFSPGNAYAPEVWGSWSQHIASWTGQPNAVILPVRYEDMLSMPAAVFRTLADFVGQPATDRVLSQAIRLSSFERLQAVEREGGFVEAMGNGRPFFRKGRAGEWRDVLSESQASRVVTVHHEQMGRVGYMTADLERLIA